MTDQDPWWKGEKENNGPSRVVGGDVGDEPGSWIFSTREIYEILDIDLPRKDRFRTLRHELVVYRDGEPLGVVALSSEDWYALAELALITARRVAAAGL